MKIPDVGDPFSWTPTAFTFGACSRMEHFGAVSRVNGRVVYVNLEHGWFRAEGTIPGGTIRECFHFEGDSP